MDTIQLPTLIEGNNGFGGASLGAGFIGGLVLGSIWNGGGFGPWGNRGMSSGQGVADVALQSGIQNLTNQVQQGNISQLQSTNAIGMQIANSSADVTAGINANTVTALQSQNALQQQICCCCNNMMREIDNTGDQTVAAINTVGSNVIAQGYEARLQNQALAAQLAGQHAELSRQIFEENCKDRELQREIQSQAIRDQLTQTQAANAALTAQINLTNQLTAQTAYLIDRLTPATAARTATQQTAG